MFCTSRVQLDVAVPTAPCACATAVDATSPIDNEPAGVETVRPRAVAMIVELTPVASRATVVVAALEPIDSALAETSPYDALPFASCFARLQSTVAEPSGAVCDPCGTPEPPSRQLTG